MQYKYKISVIMPVYNSDLYISEAIDSIVSQSLGFESIQLIIVNDGSTDNSAEIIKGYQAKYPNITYIEKENGGVSSARNEALTHIEGKYTAFLDPDDTIKSNTYADVIDFFEQNYDKTSVVSFPIRLFGSIEAEHPLNAKFQGENRVIDLLEAGEFQLHITSSIIKSEIAKNMHFKPLVASEDAEALLRVLIDTPRLGIVNTALYNYRKHEVSLINTAPNKKGWYFEHLNGYFNSIINYTHTKYEKIPTFVQNALMYDLSWKMSQRSLPLCLTEKEADEFISEFYKIVSVLDDNVILKATQLNEITKYHLLLKKHSCILEKSKDDIIGANGTVRLSFYPYVLEFLDICDDKIRISARLSTTIDTPKVERVVACINGKHVESSSVTYEPRAMFLGKEIISSAMLDIELSSTDVNGKTSISLGFKMDGVEVISNNVCLGKFFPIEQKYASSFAVKNGFLVSYAQNTLVLERTTSKKAKRCRRVFEKELWKSNGFAERKAVIARILSRIYKRLHKKPIWIISDRLSAADDNGEVLFEYLNKEKFKQANYYYAIRRGEDYSRLKKQGKVLDRASLKYKILFLAADIVISSQAEEFVLNPFDYYGQPYKDILSEKKFVFLQHGVIKDDLSAWLNKYNKNIKGFVTSAMMERNSILENKSYHYTEDEVWLTGLARFDRLENESERVITIIPTWRRYLVGNIDIATGKWKQSEKIKHSKYIRFWNALLNNSTLVSALEKYGYKILLVPHPNMKGMCDFIDTPPCVSICNKSDYRELYKKSSLMITDYSSAVFDFAYLGKTIIYAQFDKDEFFSGIHSYNKGYFDYEKNGFGKVTYTLDETVSAVIQCIENGCENEKLYLDRIDDFFAYRDKDNCKRIVEKIIKLGAKNDNDK